MRVLVLSSLYPPHSVGGYEHACKDVVDRWRASGHEVSVLTSRAGVGATTDGNDDGTRRELTLLAGGPPDQRHPATRLERLAAAMRDRRSLRAAVRRVRPDVISVWHMGGITSAVIEEVTRTGVPLVWMACDPWPIYWASNDPTRVGRLGRIRRWSDPGTAGTWVACSRSLADELEADAPWTIHVDEVVGLGVDRREFPAGAAARTGWGWRILSVGRIVPEKGPETAIRALPVLPEATLVLMGQGEAAYLRHLKSVASELGVEDRLTITHAARRQLREHYLEADAVVFPSEWNEPFGIVPLEAMACARPVVATGVGGSADFLEDGVNCLVFGAGDPDALADRIARLAEDQALRERLVSAGSRTASEWTTDRLAERLEEIHVAAASRAPAAVGQADGGPSSSSGAE